MTNLRTHRLVAVLVALTLTAAACSSSTDNNVTTDAATDVAAVTEVTTPAPTTTIPATIPTVDEPTATTVPLTAPTITTTEAATDTDVDVDAGTPDDGDLSVDTDETAIEITQPNYENRHPDSVLPDSAYLDHDAIRALFPECPPAYYYPDWVVEHDDFWFTVFENWDTETVTLSGDRVHPSGGEKMVVSGWWTDEQVEMYMPGGWLTEARVRAKALYDEGYDTVLLYGPEPPPGAGWSEMDWGVADPGDDTVGMQVISMRLQTANLFLSGIDDVTSGDVLVLLRRNDLAGYNTTTDTQTLGTLIWEWTTLRLQEMPIDEEPTAWGVHTLLNTRNHDCVAEQMLNICNADREIDSPLLEPTHRIGQVLRSIVCEFKN